MASTESELAEYHQFLLKRSFKGLMYRKLWLYPRVSARLKGRALDVGCGLGDFVRFRPGTVGIDINPHNIEYCHAHGLTDTHYVTGKWPFPDESFDSVIFDNVIEHLEDPTDLMNEITRVLKKGGRLLVGTPTQKGYDYDADHKVYYPEPLLVKTIEAFGYKKVEVFHVPIRSSFLEKLMRQYCIYGVFDKN